MNSSSTGIAWFGSTNWHTGFSDAEGCKSHEFRFQQAMSRAMCFKGGFAH